MNPDSILLTIGDRLVLCFHLLVFGAVEEELEHDGDVSGALEHRTQDKWQGTAGGMVV